MKFFAYLALASAVLATPAPRDNQQQVTVVDAISNAVAELDTATKANCDAILNAVDSVKNSVSATVIVQAQAAIKANYKNIVAAMQKATGSIVSVTTGAAGGVVKQAQGLTQSQIDQLTSSVKDIIAALNRIGASITVTTTNILPVIIIAVAGEVNATKQVIGPFVAPLMAFVNAASTASATAGLQVTGLRTALVQLVAVLQRQQASLGIPLPDLPIIKGSLGSALV